MNNICINIKLYGVVTVGPKGQIVIPKEIREKLNLKTGSTLAIILKDEKYLGFVKNEDIGDLYNYIESENK